MPPEVRLVFSGFEVGNHVYSGGALASCAPEDSPCRRAYGDVVGEGKERRVVGSGWKIFLKIRIFLSLLFICCIYRSSWDPLTLVAAVRGAAGVR